MSSATHGMSPTSLDQAHDLAERREDLELQYQSIVENAVEGIFQTTPDGRFVRANPALARMLGYDSPDDLIHSLTDIGHQLYMDPQQRAEFMRRLAEAGQVSGFVAQVYRK